MAAGRSSTGISPRPMLMGAAHDALWASNARVSLSCLHIIAHRLPHLFCGLVLSLACLAGVPSCGLATDFMAHRPTGSTQTDRIRLPYATRRLSLSRWGGPGIGKGGKGKILAFCQGLKGQARITARISRISRQRFMWVSTHT